MSPKAALEQRQKIYRYLCYVLSERIDQVGWDEFSPADRDLFAQMAEREGVAPLMYWKLKDSTVEVPPSTFNFLRSTYYKTLAQNTLMYQELERILAALDEAGIEVIVLKGAALAAMVYEDIGLRPMGDLDLLVRREDLAQAVSILNTLGFNRSGNPGLAPWLDRIAKHDIQLRGGVHGEVIVELHWSLVAGNADSRSPSLEWFWEGTQSFVPPTSTANLNLGYDRSDLADTLATGSSILEPSAHLLYLAAHLFLQHEKLGAQLLWLYDIKLLISNMGSQLEWNILVERSKLYGWSSAVFSTFQQLLTLFKTPVPPAITSEFSSQEDLSSDSIRLIQRKTSRSQTLAAYDMDRLMSLNVLDGLIFAVATTFPSPAYIRWRYQPRPIWLWPLCYLYRWFRMLRELIYTVLKILLPNLR